MVVVLTISANCKINVYNLNSNKNCLVKQQNVIASAIDSNRDEIISSNQSGKEGLSNNNEVIDIDIANEKQLTYIPLESKKLLLMTKSIIKDAIGIINDELEIQQLEYYDYDFNPINISKLEKVSSNSIIETTREINNWEYKGKIGVEIVSQGVVKCGYENNYFYYLIPMNIKINTNYLKPRILLRDLKKWNSNEISCFTNTLTIPMAIVASESEIIEESNQNRLCFYGRKTTDSDDNQLIIKSNLFELQKNQILPCFFDAFKKNLVLPLVFQLQHINYIGMNSCFCGILGN